MKIYYDLSGKWSKTPIKGEYVCEITIDETTSDWEVSELVSCLINPDNKFLRTFHTISKGASHV